MKMRERIVKAESIELSKTKWFELRINDKLLPEEENQEFLKALFRPDDEKNFRNRIYFYWDDAFGVSWIERDLLFNPNNLLDIKLITKRQEFEFSLWIKRRDIRHTIPFDKVIEIYKRIAYLFVGGEK